MTARPLIGVLMDHAEEGSFSSRPHYALRVAYFEAIRTAGGLPVGLPYLADEIDAYLDRIDGLVIPGGFYPFPAAIYGRPAPADETVHPRHAFEAELTRAALDRDMPILGVCAGMQVLAAAEGALLVPSLRDEDDTLYDHLNGQPAEQTTHPIRIEPGTLLHRIVGAERMAVNSAHNEALKTAPETLVVNARAPDGVVEGIELPAHHFALGVQWHPEFFLTEGDPNRRIFEALVTASRG